MVVLVQGDGSPSIPKFSLVLHPGDTAPLVAKEGNVAAAVK
jgi:hypothetical protein